ncbi:type VI secretion system protein TssL, short form [Pseudomonas sp. X10]
MSRTATEQQLAAATLIDSLLQNSYLLVVELQYGATAVEDSALWVRCVQQVETLRQALGQAGLGSRSVDLVSHALCALLDETVLNCAKGQVHAGWVGQPLQARFFNHYQAGEFFYEELREVLREASPDLHVLTAFQRVLALGFRGRYSQIDDPERVQLLEDLQARVAPLSPARPMLTQASVGTGSALMRGLRSPWVHAGVVMLLLIGTWWMLDHRLDSLVASLARGLS